MRRFRLPVAILALVAIAACGGGKSSSNGGGSNAGYNSGSRAAGNDGGAMTSGTAARMPNCGAVRPVWVNLRTKKYHEEGDPAYGHTKQGEYLCPSQAERQGFVRAGGGGRRHHRHHRNRSESGDYQSNGNDQSDNGDQTDSTSNP